MTITLDISADVQHKLETIALRNGQNVEGVAKDLLRQAVESIGRNDSKEPQEEMTLAESLADLLEEARQVQRAVPIYSDDPVKQQVAEAVREKFRRQGFEI